MVEREGSEESVELSHRACKSILLSGVDEREYDGGDVEPSRDSPSPSPAPALPTPDELAAGAPVRFSGDADEDGEGTTGEEISGELVRRACFCFDDPICTCDGDDDDGSCGIPLSPFGTVFDRRVRVRTVPAAAGPTLSRMLGCVCC